MGEAFLFLLRKFLNSNWSRENENYSDSDLTYCGGSQHSEGAGCLCHFLDWVALYWGGLTQGSSCHQSSQWSILLCLGSLVQFQGRNLLIEIILKMDSLASGSDWMVVWRKEVRRFLWNLGKVPFLLLAFYSTVTLKHFCHYLTFILASTYRPGRV